MGRKRGKPKVRVNLSIDEKLLEELENVGVNKSKLFSLSAKMYLRKISKNVKFNEKHD